MTSQPKNPFTNADEYNAIFPWSHPLDAFCKCSRCHLVRAQRIMTQCAVLRRGLEMLQWPSLSDAGAAMPMPGDTTVVSKLPKKETA